MKIESFPRPHNDTGIGFSYFADVDHYGREDVDRWVPLLQELGASWLVMQALPSRPVPDAFLQRLMMANIEPVVILKPETIGPLDQRELTGTIRSLADSGVHYVVLFDRPNLRAHWSPAEWSKPALVERFVDFLVPALETAVAEEVTPVLPALEPFGEYWDTVFLQAMLQSLQRRGLGELLPKLAVGMRNFAQNRPLDWGQGGRSAWPQARPYRPLVTGQDHRGFCLYQWYQEIITDVVGQPLPLIACANGPQASLAGNGADALSPTDYAEHVFQMGQMMLTGDLPESVMNLAFWVLSAEKHQPVYEQRWFDPDGAIHHPAVNALENLPHQPRPTTAVEEVSKAMPTPSVSPIRKLAQRASEIAQSRRKNEPAPDTNGSQKPIEHYLLLPVFEWGVSRWHLEIIQEYVEAFRPTVGFTADEAQMAQKVTIIGNEQGIDTATESSLQAAGCLVERVAGKNGRETELLLKELARNKQPTG